jgi:hypothetical protein
MITTVALGLLAAGGAPYLLADEVDKETRLTINQPLLVQDTLLVPGHYVFKLLEPGIAAIYNVDSARPERIVIGVSAYRVDAGDRQIFTVSPAEGSRPAALQTWFYPGENSGLEFLPKEPASHTVHVAKSKRKAPATDPTNATSTP